MNRSEGSRPEVDQAVIRKLVCGLFLCIAGLFLFAALQVSLTLWSQSDSSNQPDYQFKLRLAEASAAEMQLIPGLGETLSQRWILERDALMQRYPDPLQAISHMRGVGKQKLEVIRQYSLEHSTAQETAELAMQSSANPQ